MIITYFNLRLTLLTLSCLRSLFQQALQAAAASIAATYTTDDKAEWIAAASTLRTPYWDWVHNSVPPPEVISTAALQIITPTSNGQLSPFVNPLLAYAFHPLDPSFEAINPCSKWPSTLRHPTTNGPDAVTSTESLIRYAFFTQNRLSLSLMYVSQRDAADISSTCRFDRDAFHTGQRLDRDEQPLAE